MHGISNLSGWVLPGLSMRIRPAADDDVVALIPLWHGMMELHAGFDSSYQLNEAADIRAREHFRRLCGDKDRLLLVCQDQIICGYISATVRSSPPVFAAARVGLIQELSVAPAYQRRGVGRALFAEATAWMKNQGLQRMEVRTLLGNEQSNGFWRSMGCEPYAMEYKSTLISPRRG